MWIRYIILGVIGLSSGAAVAGGEIALIVKIGVIPRLAGFTRTAKKVFIYEDSLVLGALAGTVLSLMSIRLPFGVTGLAVYGIFSGLFLGCMVVALAEVLNVIPILFRRVRIKKGAGFVILSMALGKLLGSLLYFLKNWEK